LLYRPNCRVIMAARPIHIQSNTLPSFVDVNDTIRRLTWWLISYKWTLQFFFVHVRCSVACVRLASLSSRDGYNSTVHPDVIFDIYGLYVNCAVKHVNLYEPFAPFPRLVTSRHVTSRRPSYILDVMRHFFERPLSIAWHSYTHQLVLVRHGVYTTRIGLNVYFQINRRMNACTGRYQSVHVLVRTVR